MKTANSHGGFRPGAGRPTTERKCSLSIRISQIAKNHLESVGNVSKYIDELIIEDIKNN